MHSELASPAVPVGKNGIVTSYKFCVVLDKDILLTNVCMIDCNLIPTGLHYSFQID